MGNQFVKQRYVVQRAILGPGWRIWDRRTEQECSVHEFRSQARHIAKLANNWEEKYRKDEPVVRVAS